MATSDGHARRRSSGTDPPNEPIGITPIAVRPIRWAIEWLGFWTAVMLPLAYLYLLVRGVTGPELLKLVQLLGLHLVALVAGRGYRAGSAT